MNTQLKHERLERIAQRVAKCRRCSLYKYATHGVPGEGNPDAKVMFIGEGPGYHEDQEGRPFVGQAGKLLDQLLQSIQLDRKEVFIGNMVKHRPPNNRDPLPEEIEACQIYLDKQVAVIDPEIIVTLGRFSMTKFLPGESISVIHGRARYIEFGGKRRIVIPMYHPAAALRAGKIMEEIKKDFQQIRKFLVGETDSPEEEKPASPKGGPKEEQLKLV